MMVARQQAVTQPSQRIQDPLGSPTLTRSATLFQLPWRNGRAACSSTICATAVGAYSTRARPGSPFAAPVTWRQVEAGIQPDAFTIGRPFPKRASRP